MESLLSLQEVLGQKNKYNLALPFTESCQVNPFYKISVSAVYADTREAAAEIFKVGSRRTDGDRWEPLYSLAKPFLNRLATQAGIQFAPGSGDVIKMDENTWKASAYGALTLPDGVAVRTSSNSKVIDLVTEEKKYRLSYEEKAAGGIRDFKAAKEAEKEYAGEWADTGERNDKGCPVKKYVIKESERGRYIEKSLLDAMTQLRATAPQKAATGAILRVIRELLGIKGTYTMEELKKPFAVARAYFSPDYNDPAVRQAMLRKAVQSTGSMFGCAGLLSWPVSIPRNSNIGGEACSTEDAAEDVIEDIAGDITENVTEDIAENDMQEYGAGNNPPDETGKGTGMHDRSLDFSCDKCGAHIEEKVWDYSIEKFQRPLCYRCQKLVRNGQGGGRRQ